MSIEGMWCFVSGETGSSTMESGGVVILDTQRIYGGDSAMAFIGKYDVDGTTVTGQIESFRYNPHWEGQDVFGDEAGPTRQTGFKVSHKEKDFLVGHLTRGEKTLPILLKKLRDLP